jgi:hypothetical protein
MASDHCPAHGHQPFRFRTASGLLRKAEALGLDVPFDAGIGPLLQPRRIASRDVPNRMAVQPMEGVDSEPAGVRSGPRRRDRLLVASPVLGPTAERRQSG